MSEVRRQSASVRTTTGGGLWQNERVRRAAFYAVALLLAFLLGLIPMWLRARAARNERDQANTLLRASELQNSLASAALDARQGRYEPARRSASEFFTNLRAEIERGSEAAFAEAGRNDLRALLATRDDTITLLARNDPASAERLAELYNLYREASGAASRER